MVTRDEGVAIYDAPCLSTATVKGSLRKDELITYDLSKPHRRSDCPAADQYCWVYVTGASGKEGWVQSGLPGQPQQVPCGVAPGKAFLSCCPNQPCTQRVENTVLFGGEDAWVNSTRTAVECLKACKASSTCQYSTFYNNQTSQPVCLLKSAPMGESVFAVALTNAVTFAEAPAPMPLPGERSFVRPLCLRISFCGLLEVHIMPDKQWMQWETLPAMQMYQHPLRPCIPAELAGRKVDTTAQLAQSHAE